MNLEERPATCITAQGFIWESLKGHLWVGMGCVSHFEALYCFLGQKLCMSENNLNVLQMSFNSLNNPIHEGSVAIVPKQGTKTQRLSKLPQGHTGGRATETQTL